MGNLTYNGTSASSIGLLVSGSGTFDIPERVVSTVPIPGRNGLLIEDGGRWENQEVRYPATIAADLASVRNALAAWVLAGASGYKRLTDSYHTGEFRLARFVGPVEMKTWPRNRGADLELVFDCQPERWLTSGETVVSYSAQGTISNQTPYDALPLITVHGSGTGNVQIGSNYMTLTGFTDGTVIDCQTRTCYKGSTNKNGIISGDFLKIHPGSNTVKFTGGVTGIDIKPRWYIL